MAVSRRGGGRFVTASSKAGPVSSGGFFRHIGLLYRDEEHYARACAGWLAPALERREPVLVVVPGDGGERIRAELGPRSGGVRFADMAVEGRNPARIIPAVLLAFAAGHPGRRVWIIGEPVWKGRSDLAYPPCVVHEALINLAFAGHDAALLCPYDTSRLTEQAIADAARTHPLLGDGAAVWDSPSYTDPLEAAALFDRPLPAPPEHAATHRFSGVGMLPVLRSFTAARARAAGLDDDRVTEVLIAVNELATNTAEYTGAPGTLSVWTEDGALVCQIDDTGHISDPLAGRLPADDGAGRGRGLLIVNELADLTRVHHHAAGMSTRLYFDLPLTV
ncbi:sensor histidine kinase (plasmid) [Sphaerisporangium sp. TRM90804]|nr:sensor histidine kinase [Sphaerisporangium sp. TRM90804]MDH2424174.1 sensor histidine kinase [Sphaerisporangium sp. TRM90804]